MRCTSINITLKVSNDTFSDIQIGSKYSLIGCGHTWDLTLVKGFNRGKKDVKKLYYSKTH